MFAFSWLGQHHYAKDTQAREQVRLPLTFSPASLVTTGWSFFRLTCFVSCFVAVLLARLQLEFDIEKHRPGLLGRLGFEQIAPSSALPHHDLDDGMRRRSLAHHAAAAKGGRPERSQSEAAAAAVHGALVSGAPPRE